MCTLVSGVWKQVWTLGAWEWRYAGDGLQGYLGVHLPTPPLVERCLFSASGFPETKVDRQHKF